MTKIFISCALPYANGPCHLGHLRSTYIPADIYARYNRMAGNEVLMVCATDEHGTPIAVRADAEGKKPIEIAKRYHDMIEEDIKSCDITLDNFARTSDELHYKISQDFFLYLYNKGLIYEEAIQQLYCEDCEKFLPDRYVEGICPVCGADARGDHCESCGRALDPVELEEPKCLTCGHTPVIRDSTQYFFKLSHFQSQLEEYISTNEYLPANVRNYAENWLKEGLQDWIMTRDMKWGIPVPLDGAEGKVIYVWGEAFIGYISSAAAWSRRTGIPWEDYWDGHVVHFIGKDIIYHHSLFWPAMLMGRDCKLPDDIFAGEFLSLEGRKMSTSKNWVIWVSDFVKDFESDLLRYYLTVNAPLNKDTDFSWDDFGRRINDELADVIGNFLHRTFTFTKKFFDSMIPEYADPSEEDLAFEEEIKGLAGTVGELISTMKFREGLVEIVRVAKAGNKYFNDMEPWKAVKENPQKAANCLYLSNQLSHALAILLKPYIPNKADAICDIMNISHDNGWDDASEFLDSGHQINKAKPLFKKIDPEVIEAQKEKLYKNLEEHESDSKKDEGEKNKSKKDEGEKNKSKKEKTKEDDGEKMDLISIDDFAKVEIKIGQVVECEKIEKSNKLLKTQIDIGDKTIQVVAGLGKRYAPEDLIGKKLPVVTNLKPAKLMGEKSEGMIMATESAAILTPDDCEIGELLM
ncbi:methionine--tRNA ligase [uncultured Methanobrevibacter sp.]|uniref:methionine--tRNA ligase n=1 Tax=uncultured Methanobrevibacter sp. TaxID=253161 RepID=UPI002609F269